MVGLLFLGASLVLSCGSFGDSDVGGEGAPLRISAAASLKDVFGEISRRFSEETGRRVELQFAASGVLEKQIMGGAPVDVFASASPAQMDRLEQAGKIPAGSRADLASNRLVVIAPEGSSLQGEALDALLTRPEVTRIAVGDPALVPAGSYAKEALISLSLWDGLSGRVVFGANVRQVLDLVGRREAEIGFVYQTDLVGRSDVKIIGEIPKEAAPEILYCIGVLSDSSQGEAARAFVEFATGPSGQEILERHGFVRAPSPKPSSGPHPHRWRGGPSTVRGERLNALGRAPERALATAARPCGHSRLPPLPRRRSLRQVRLPASLHRKRRRRAESSPSAHQGMAGLFRALRDASEQLPLHLAMERAVAFHAGLATG